MNLYEFFIRLSMINGHKLSKIRKLSNFPYTLTIDSPVKFLYELGFTHQQITEFKQVSNKKIFSTLKWLDKSDHYFIHYYDKHYPKLLQTINSPPLVLFIQGNINLLPTPQLAMIGSRKNSEYGKYAAEYFTKHLVAANFTVTSGLALGIDGICHDAALAAGGKTIGVLGSGLSEIYPKKHNYLAERIINKGGALVSEFLPNQIARPSNFPRRNRIISGLCLGTFVIEAAEKSGSLITAHYALEQHRDIFVLPGDIRNKNYQGNHFLIKQGAYLVTEPNDIIDILNNTTLRFFTQTPLR